MSFIYSELILWLRELELKHKVNDQIWEITKEDELGCRRVPRSDTKERTKSPK